MKNWKPILLVAGILLLIAAFAVYAARIASCYPPANILAQFSPEYVKSFQENCKLDTPLTTQFSGFLALVIPEIILFSSYWLLTQPRVKNRRICQLSAFLLLLMFYSLLVMLYGLFGALAQGIIAKRPGSLGGGSHRRTWFLV